MATEPEIVEQELDQESKQLARVVQAPAPAEFRTMRALAENIAGTRLVPEAYRGKPDEIMACYMVARELGIGTMYALQHIFITEEGKQGMSASLMRTLVRRDGHSIRPIEMTDKQSVVWGKRKDNGDEATVTWTIEDARRAGLLAKRNWTKYPMAMLFARACSQLVRVLFDECTAGIVYTPEELEDVDFEGAFQKAQGKVERKSGDRVEAPTGDGAGDGAAGDRYIVQAERDALKALARERGFAAEQLAAIVREAFESFNEYDERAQKAPFSNMRARHADYIRKRLSAPAPDPAEGLTQTELPT